MTETGSTMMSGEELAAIFRQAPAAMTLTTLDGGVVLDVSDWLQTLFGYTREEIIGRSIIELGWLTPDARARLVARLREERSVRDYAMSVHTRDGRWIDVLYSGRIVNANGQACLISSLTDITPHKEVETALREQEQLFHIMSDWTLDWEMWTAPDGTLRFMSPSVEGITGYPPAAFTADPELMTRIIHPDDLPIWREHYRRYLTNDRDASDIEFRIITRDGATRWIHHRCRPVFGRDGVYLGRRASNRDVTGRHYARTRLQQQGLVLDQIQDCVIITDLQGVITYINDANCRLLGRARDTLIGQHIGILGDDPTRGASQAMILEQTMRNGEWRGTVVNFTADGDDLVLDCRTQLVRDEFNTPVAICGVSTDITAQSHAEELLRTQRNLAMALGQSRDLADTLRFSLLGTLHVAGMDCGAVFLVDSDSGALNLAHATGFPEEFLTPFRHLPADDDHTRFVKAGQTHFATSALLDTLNRRLAPSDQLTALAIIPIHHDGRVIGSLHLASHTLDAIPSYAHGTLETMANQIGEAIVREQTQEALRDSEERYRALIEHAAEAVGVVQDGCFQFLNARAELMTGYTVDELLALPFMAIIHPDDRAYIAENHQRRLRGEPVPQPYRARFVRKDGGICWVDIQGSVINWHGKPATLNLYTDITEQQLADIRRRIEHARTRTLLELYARAAQMTDQELYSYVLEQAVALSDSEIGFLHHVSDDGQHVDLTIWNQETQQHCTVQFSTHDLETRAGIWAQCLHDGQPVICNDYQNYPRRCGLPPGHAPVNRVMGVPVLDGERIRLILAVGNKIEAYDESDVVQLQFLGNELQKIMLQRRAEAALRESEARWQFALEGAGDGVWDWSVETDQVFFSRQWKAMLGYAEDELASTLQEWESRIHPEDKEAVFAALMQHFSGQTPVYVSEHRLRGKDGSYRWILGRGTVINRGADGQPLRMIGTHTDITARKEAEEALRVSESRYRSLFTEMQNGFALHRVICDDSGTPVDYVTLEVNEAFGTLMGVEAEQVVGHRASEFLGPTELRDWMAIFGHVALTGESARYEQYSAHNERSYEGVAYCPEPGQFAVVFADVTERKQSETALRQSEERYRRLFSEMQNGFALFRVICDDTGAVVDYVTMEVNQAYETLLGLSRKAVIGCRASMCLSQEALQEWLAIIGPVAQTGESARYEFCVAETGRCYGGVAYSPEPGQVAVVFEDITERLHAEEAMRLSEERYRNIFMSAAVGMVEVSLDGRIYQVNPAFAQFLGYTETDLIGRTVLEITHPDDRASSAQAMQVMLSGQNGTQQFEKRYLHRDGSVVWGAVSISVTHHGDGTPGNLVAQILDITARKQIEAALRDSEAQLRTLVQSIPDIVMRFDHDGRHLYASPNVHTVTPFTAEEFTGKTHRDMGFPEAMCAYWEEAIATIFRDGQPTEDEFIFASAIGPITFNWRLIPEFDEHGAVQSVLSISRDVSAHKRAEAALRENEAQLRTLMQNIPDIVCRFDREGRHLYASPNIVEVGALAADDYLGKTQRELGFNEDECAFWARAFTTVFETGQPCEVELTQDSVTRAATYNWRLVPEHGADGAVQTILSICRDVTERKLAEEALRASEARFRTIVEHVNDAFIIHTCDGLILDANDVANRLYGGQTGKAIGTNLRDTSPPEVNVLIPERMEQLLRDGGIVFDSEKLLADGTRVPVSISARLISREGRGIVHSFIRDMSERQRLESQLLQAQKMESIGRLAGGVAHDFNNMLMVILNSAEEVLATLPADSPQYEELQEIRKAGKRSAELTRQLLAFARKQAISPQPLDLNEAVAGMLAMLRRLIGESIHLAWAPGFNTWPVHMDPSQLDQLLANLAVNARDAINGVGEVTIDTANVTLAAPAAAEHGVPAGEYVRMCVRDTGCGISADALPHIFEPFFTTKGLESGTGLGLATVYGIVTQNGGAITVESAQGQGTTFQIYLPRHRATPIATEVAAPAPQVIAGLETVLMVEDEEAILRVGRMVLERLGYTVLTATRPLQALELAAAHPDPIHLLITDMVMPEMNGYELSQQLLALRPEMKCLYMSGYTADIAMPDETLRDGMRFLQKPFTMTALAERVRIVLDDTES